MKIVFTGGGTGGHFYPIISVAQSIKRIAKEKKIIAPKLYFMAPAPYNRGILYDEGIEFIGITAGKVRVDNSLANFLDLFMTGLGCLRAIWVLFMNYPDVVFSKGGFGAFPVVFAARILSIPVIIHESDSAPGKVNLWTGKFAFRIAVSYKEAAASFPPEKVAVTGQPVLPERQMDLTANSHEFFNFSPTIQTIFIVGGSQGAERINTVIMDALADLVKDYQVIHQTGEKNVALVKEITDAVLLNNPLRPRYRLMPYLNALEMRMAFGVADLVISRAGSTIFEIAALRKPSIIVPITTSHDNHQVKNALAYAKLGACVTIEEDNLKQHLLTAEARRILGDESLRKSMSDACGLFWKEGAADTIAQEIFSLLIAHEQVK